MPAMRPSNAQVTVRRRGNAFVHISTERTLATASNNVRVRLLLEDFDGTNGQNVVCKLIVGGVAVNPASVRPDEIVDTRSRWREYRFTPGAATTKYKIRIEGGGVTSAHPWHVAERYDLAL